MKFNHDELRGKIKAKFGTQEAFAEKMGMSTTALSSRLTGRSEWSRPEISLAVELLEIATCDIGLYFFTPQSSQNQTA